ncbi:NAD(P)-dependent dehydrogenase (short-subunit alcohol dehydrogenase family) [Wenyingzhuangia heitensis]|uniref:NAD(P)-dependent dehydrogenase (Short-subunit alcohol dehydrogenase family) n=1 Tax=Wenyingzhuangia heitensis TaxID=1487859 RepID=A0ABX0U5N0_9FLAO|nr:glucose 1-dehydrogenase [Wenyingzhuangia heitensis]NIJ44078.1 NAD(P)-dependent dehydrogenase (short-subunit alcohol dehydrogenase family) [Wenyingzhuangia heitensis]
MKSLKGKTALITGASKGIGAEIARCYAKNGAKVIVNYLSGEVAAQNLVNEITIANGIAKSIKADVSKIDEIKILLSETEKHFGKIDILVNNAGVYHFEPFEMIQENEFYRQINANLLSVLFTSQQALNHFNPNGGSIINISSIATVKATPMTVLYSATKGAVDAITTTLAKELAPKKIRVNAILPGPTHTEGNKIKGSEMGDFITNQIPLGRLGTTKDTANAAIFLGSDNSEWITGQKIGVSGGFD